MNIIKLTLTNGYKINAFVSSETSKAVQLKNERNESIWIPKSLLKFTDDFFCSARIVKVSKFFIDKLLTEENKRFFECA